MVTIWPLTLGTACHFLSRSFHSCTPPFDLRNISHQNSLITIAIVLVLYSIKLFRYSDIKVFERYSVVESREPNHLEYSGAKSQCIWWHFTHRWLENYPINTANRAITICTLKRWIKRTLSVPFMKFNFRFI